jgi:hypothetical protein
MHGGWRTRVLILLLIALSGCGKDKAVGPKPDEITGLWRATRVEYVNKADPNQRVELIAAGDTVRVAILGDHNFAFIRTRAGGSPDTTTGTWRLDGDLFRVRPTGMPFEWVWDVSLSGSSLTLKDADVEFDVNNDALMEMTKQTMVLVR